MVATPPNDADMSAMPMPQRETPAVHGMFMFGSDTVFLSHMPMFAMANHQYQVVLQVTLPPDAMNLYRTRGYQGRSAAVSAPATHQTDATPTGPAVDTRADRKARTMANR